ncbi:helicase-primase primase subunit [Saimiriine alphaherpesvirus 1]|uniref:Helicase-primase primase subunit n=1 Tax=Saimiriine herpesvirus 1 (strain MV-5-4-PSL) TaxID=10353 RepID=E2IUB8_SHV1|nr:helicase-primase primase subunit [Saimiriine alphaherpesvirus 1]ADO13776.1 helicase-primase primase subunit [Saimiriine alphaherpesvirus 1]
MALISSAMASDARCAGDGQLAHTTALARERPRGTAALATGEVSVSVLYATDGCVISSSLALLTNCPGAERVYVLSYDVPEERSDETGGPTGPPPELSHQDRFERSLARYRPVRELNGLAFRATFCLLGQQAGGASEGTPAVLSRVRPMFVCRFAAAEDAEAFRGALQHGDPLSPELLARTLDEEATFAIHNPLIIALTVAVNRATARVGRTSSAAEYRPGESLRAVVSGPTPGRRGLLSLYVHHEPRVLATYRRAYYGSAQSPFWFVSKFGPDEKSLVLVTRYYLFQATARRGGTGATYDLQAVRDFCATYDVLAPRPGESSRSDLMSFAAISRFCCTSGYASGPIAAGFPLYVERRIVADVRETSALKEFIAHDRHCLKISDREFITYVYLAYFECFNRPRLTRHLRAVSARHPEPARSEERPSQLGREAIEQFFTHVRAHLNIHEYVKQNVSPRETVLRGEAAAAFLAARTYAASTLAAAALPRGAYDYSCKMAARLAEAEQTLAKHGWPASLASPTPTAYPSTVLSPCFPPDTSGGKHGGGPPPGCGIVRRLLQLAASERPGATPAIAALFGTPQVATPMPVYRVAMAPTGQAFAVMAADEWSRITRDGKLPAAELQLELRAYGAHKNSDASDESLGQRLARRLQSLRTRASPLPASTVGGQMYINRNEIFNAGLAVTNIVLDLDIALKEPVPFDRLYRALGFFRKGTLTAARLLFPEAQVDWDAYPCYFFKSACPTWEADGDSVGARGRWKGFDRNDPALGDLDEFYLDAMDCMPPEDPADAAMDADEESTYYDDPMDFEQADRGGCGAEPLAPSSTRGEDAGEKGVFSRPMSQPQHFQTPRLSETPLCTCRKKIGLRVCLPVPRPYVISGASTMRGVAQVIQQAVLLERDFVETVGAYVKNFLLIDTGVYAHSHSLRLPYFAKIADGGLVTGKLLPVFVFPPACADPASFIAAHTDPNNFHFHAPRSLSPVEAIGGLRVLHSLGGDYISFFERKATHNALTHFGRKDTLAEVLARYGTELGARESVELLASELLARVNACLESHYPEYTEEYRSVSVHRAAAKKDWVLLQLVPARGSLRQNLSCLRFKHSRSSRATARTFLALSVGADNSLCVSFCQQCFAAKCDSNRLRTLFTFTPDSPCSPSGDASTVSR